jgi:hypothetical protein
VPKSSLPSLQERKCQLSRVTISRKGQGDCDAQGLKDQRKVKGKGFKSREERSREQVRAKSNWRFKHDEPVGLVVV